MTTGPDGERRQEPTFADVMNGFGLDSGRPVRRRLFGRRRGSGVGDADLRETARPAGLPLRPLRRCRSTATATWRRRVPAAHRRPGRTPTTPRAWPRPSARIRGRGGRTKSGFDLAIETLVSTSPRGRAQAATLQVEHRAVAELCEQTRSGCRGRRAAVAATRRGAGRARRHGRAGCGDRAPDREQRRQRAGPRIDGKGVEWTPSALVTCPRVRGARTRGLPRGRQRTAADRHCGDDLGQDRGGRGASASARPRSSDRCRRSCR
jgi:hypothetical protein